MNGGLKQWKYVSGLLLDIKKGGGSQKRNTRVKSQ